MSVLMLTKSTQVFCFLLDAALHAFVLALIVWLVCRVFRAWLRPQFRILLWALVLVRLVLPISPVSELSLFEHVPSLEVAQHAFEQADSLQPDTKLRHDAAHSAKEIAGSNIAIEAGPTDGQPLWSWSFVWNVAAMVWLTGSFVLAVRLAGQTWLLYRKRGSWRKPNDRLLAVWKQCFVELGVRRHVDLRVADDGVGPGAFGLLRPCVVLPSTLADEESAEGLRHVLLHELTHIIRGDVIWKCFAHAVTIVHWFNPLAWRISRHLLDEIELACDADVLLRFDEKTRQDYGHTVLHVAETQLQPAELALVGFAQQDNLEKRIHGIADFRRPSVLLTLASVVLFLWLAVAGLTMRKEPFSPPANEMATALAARKNGLMGTDGVAFPWPVEAEREIAKTIRDYGGYYGLDKDKHITSVNMTYHYDWAKFGGDVPKDAVEQSFRVENNTMEIKPVLEALPNLSRLDQLLVHDSQLTDEGCHLIGKLTNLKSLYAWNAKAVTDKGVKHLAGLKKLDYVHLSDSKIGDGALATLADLPSIKSLSLQGNSFSDKGLAAIRKSGIKSVVLGLGENRFSEPAVLAMLEMPNLEKLGVQGTSLSRDTKRKFRQAQIELFGDR